MDIINIDSFKSELAPRLKEYKLEYRFFDEGDFGSLNQIEFNSSKIGGNIDFWGLGWLGIFVWDYRKEEQLLNVLIKPEEEEEKKIVMNKLILLLLQ